MNKQQEIIQALGVTPTIHPKEEIRFRVDFLKEKVKESGLRGFVLGISGGQDSTLAGKLAQQAVDELNAEEEETYEFIALRLPYGIQKDEADAQLALQFINPTKNWTHNIQPEVDASLAVHQKQNRPISDFIKGNKKARARMTVQYDVAGQYRLLVLGTDHAAEAVTGFFTKFGDGAADLLPLSGLTKRQGKQLLIELGAPESLYLKKPTADLLDEKPQQTDEDELGFTYDWIDDYLEGKEVAEKEKLEYRYHQTTHKRMLPFTPFD